MDRDRLGRRVVLVAQEATSGRRILTERKVKMAAAHKGKTMKDFLMELAEGKIQELERKGIMPRGKCPCETK
jgi:hypothetical protein